MNYQWYPGHMTKAKRMMEENIKLIDLIIELVDARIPLSSRNPDIDSLGKNKFRVILLNKSDLAAKRYNDEWMKYFENKGFFVVEVNAKNGTGIKAIQGVVQEACKEKIERDRKRGIINRPIRAMVVGIPNVGKSTFINAFAGKACTKTGNKPGVTKGKQWIRMNKSIELLDTPGILWPKFDDPDTGLKLAMIGSMNDDVLNVEDLAVKLIELIEKHYSGMLQEKYGLSEQENAFSEVKDQALRMLYQIAVARRCITKGEEPDILRASNMVIDDFRSGKIGRITLEFAPEDNVENTSKSAKNAN